MAQSARPPDLDANGQPVTDSARPPDLDASGRPSMNTAMVNGQRVPVEDAEPNTVGTFVSHAAQGLNPMPLIHAVRHPLDTVAGIVDSHVQTAMKALDAYHEGNYQDAAVHALNALIPLIGPGIDKAATDLRDGKVASALGDATAIGLSVKAPEVAGRALARARVSLPANPNPAEAAAVRFGQDRGIPVDAGTATGNRFVRGVQSVTDSSPIGAFVAERAKQNQATALTRVGGEIADSVHPSAVTPEQAGSQLTKSTQGLVDSLTEQANQHYGELRKMEADPQNARMVPDVKSQAEARQLSEQMAESLGSHAPTPAELQELRRIRAEMDALPFVKRTFNEGGARSGGDMEVVGGAAGAPVYDDILANSPGTSMMSRKEVITSIDQALIGGRFTNGAKGALEVARKRLAGDTTLSEPSLPPEAGNVAAGKKPMLMPVGLAKAKEIIQPFYRRLQRESQLTPQSIMGAKAKALNAMDRLMSGPDFESLTIVDQALSDIKELARKDGGPAKLIVSALEPQVQAAVRRAGPAAVDALEKGRSAVKTRVMVEDTLDALKKEPVASYRMATAQKDSAISRLRELRDVAPDVMPQVGRAWLDDALKQATSEGGFQHAAKLDADWQRLGAETKAILYPGGQAAALDQFFLLAKKLALDPNPSGTAKVAVGSSGQLVLMFTHPTTGVPLVLGSGAVSAILHSPTAVQAMTRGLRLFSGAQAMGARLAGYQAIAQALRVAQERAPSLVPATATSEERRPRVDP